MSLTDYGTFRITSGIYDQEFPPAPDEISVWVHDPDSPESLDLMGSFGFSAVESKMDCNSPFALYNPTEFDLTVLNEFGGIVDEIVTYPELAVSRPDFDMWTLMTSGNFHRLKLTTTDSIYSGQNGEYFHVRFAEITMAYYGHTS